MAEVPPITPQRPQYGIDLTQELRIIREQDRERVQQDTELRVRVDQLERWRQTIESRRAVVTAAVATAVASGVGSLLYLLSNHHG